MRYFFCNVPHDSHKIFTDCTQFNLVVVVLLQPSTAGVGGSFGGSSGVNAFHTKRGFEKALFVATIVLGFAFVALGVFAIVFH